MELALLRSLMEKSFYDDHRGAKCPDRLFVKTIERLSSLLTKP